MTNKQKSWIIWYYYWGNVKTLLFKNLQAVISLSTKIIRQNYRTTKSRWDLQNCMTRPISYNVILRVVHLYRIEARRQGMLKFVPLKSNSHMYEIIFSIYWFQILKIVVESAHSTVPYKNSFHSCSLVETLKWKSYLNRTKTKRKK